LSATAHVPAVRITGLVVEVAGRVLLQLPRLQIEAGERVAIVGANGAGKSTLLRVLGGFMHPARGQVEVLGRRLDTLDRAAWRRLRCETGQVLQGLHLVPRLTARENVMIGALARPGLPAWRSWARCFPPALVAEADAALDALGLAAMRHLRADRLSGGERQKVGLARLQLQRPRLVLADEPTAALDPAATAQACAALRRSAAGATLLTVVHQPSLLPLLADRVLGLDAGRLVFDRPLAAVNAALLDALYTFTCARPAPPGAPGAPRVTGLSDGREHGTWEPGPAAARPATG